MDYIKAVSDKGTAYSIANYNDVKINSYKEKHNNVKRFHESKKRDGIHV